MTDLRVRRFGREPVTTIAGRVAPTTINGRRPVTEIAGREPPNDVGPAIFYHIMRVTTCSACPTR